MNPSRRHTLMLEALALAGPLLVVSGARLFFGSDPAGMSVQIVPAPLPMVAPAKPVSLTPEQQSAAAWIKSAAVLTDLASPMNHPTAAPRHMEAPKPVEPTQIVPATSPVAELTLTGVLGNSSGGLAAVNGKVFRIGDQVRAGLRLISIDVKLNAIELKADDGTVYRMVRELK